MYTGNKGVYTHTFQLDKKEHCPVCDQSAIEVSFAKDWTLQRVIDSLKERAELCVGGSTSSSS
jgi:ubiquitin-activating enzyme E1 C